MLQTETVARGSALTCSAEAANLLIFSCHATNKCVVYCVV